VADRPTRRWRRRGGRRAPIDPSAGARAEADRAAEEHRRLKERAANIIADQKLAELNLRRVLQRYDELTDHMRRTVRVDEEVTGTGGTDDADRRMAATEALAVELVNVEREIDELDARWGRARAAADEAKDRVRAHTRRLHRILAERGTSPRTDRSATPLDGGADAATGRPDGPSTPVRFGAGGEIRRAELRALLGLPAPGRDGERGRGGAPAAGAHRGSAPPPAYPVGPQPPRPDGRRRRR
jgi:hypothetical protein